MQIRNDVGIFDIPDLSSSFVAIYCSMIHDELSMTLFITELSHIVQIVHIVQIEFLFLIFEQKVLKQGWVKFSYLCNSLSFCTGIVSLQRNTNIFFSCFYHNKIHPVSNYKAIKNEINKTRQRRIFILFYLFNKQNKNKNTHTRTHTHTHKNDKKKKTR